MKINRIGFGYTKNLGNYKNCKVWLEADLEDWEDPSESFNLFRDKVAQELNLPDKWHDLKGKFNQQSQALEATNAALNKSQEKLKEAQEKWEEFAAFLVAHGVDPENLRPKSIEEIAHKLDAANDLLPLAKYIEDDSAYAESDNHPDPDYFDPYHGPEDDGDDDYPDPYYGDAYDRIHGNEDEDESSTFDQ